MPDSPSVLYAGSFDPVTAGHLDLIRRGRDLFGSLRVAVAENHDKSPLFPVSERVAMVEEETADLEGVDVVSFSGLVVDYCRSVGVRTLLRGLRSVADFESEYPMTMTNRALAPKVETVFVMPSPGLTFVSSRLIREVYAAGGELPELVTPRVGARLSAKLKPT